MTQVAIFPPMIVASTWALTWIAHALVIQLCALVAGRTIVRSPRHRGILWKVALLLPFATATLATSGMRRSAPLGDVNLPDVTGGTSAFGVNGVWVEQRVVRHGDAAPTRESFVTTSRAVAIAGAVLLLALAGATIGATTLVVRRRRFSRRLGARQRVLVDDLTTARYVVTSSPTLGAPVAIGRAEICVPADSFISLPPDERASILAHEAAHLARHDPFWFALADATVALTPWQPLVRAVARELRRDAEFCCDDAVVRERGDGHALVRSLLHFAAAFDPAETALAASCGGSPLEARARRILLPGRAAGRWGVFALILTLLLLGGGVAVAAPAISTRTTKVGTPSPRDGERRVILLQSKEIAVKR